MRFVNYSIVRFSVFLVLGILTAHFYQLSFFVLIPLLSCFLLTGILWLGSRRQLIQKVYFGVSVYCCFFGIGYLSYQIRQPQFQSDHYLHSVTEQKSYLIHVKIKEVLNSNQYDDKFIATVFAVDSSSKTGNLLVSIKKGSLDTPIDIDDVLLLYAPFRAVSKPLNPDQFDYAQYMRNQETYNQVRISGDAILKRKKGSKTLFGSAQNYRSTLVDKLKQTKIAPDEQSIIQGLILGDRTDIDKQLYEKYAAAGAVHILAVSGLHVGVLFVLLSFLFRPITQLKHGGIIRLILIVIALWSFAFLAGLSPSIIRAVSMFSFFAFAQVLGRRTNGLNNLFLSFFSLLIINPLWLFQVGFQLSYAAVFFILWLQPIFNRLGYSKYRIVRETQGLITVTVSAQLGVLPLTLFYFHQFPGLFLITNLVILPALALLMIGGILIVGLTAINHLPDWMADGCTFTIGCLNHFIGWVAGQENFLFSNLHFSTSKTLAVYVFIIALILIIRKWNYARLVFVFASIVLVIGSFIHDKSKASVTEFLIFHKSRHTLIGYKSQRNLTLFNKDSLNDVTENYPIKSYQNKNSIEQIYASSLPEIFKYGSKTVLILDSLGTFPKHRKVHTVLLTQSPKVNINRLIDSLKPQQIIADGSNYPSIINHWKQQCNDKSVSFHYTGSQGAYVLKP